VSAWYIRVIPIGRRGRKRQVVQQSGQVRRECLVSSRAGGSSGPTGSSMRRRHVPPSLICGDSAAATFAVAGAGQELELVDDG